MRRRLLHYEVVARRDGPLDIVAPDDFVLEWTSSAEVGTLPSNTLAYCADFASERVLFTCHAAGDMAALFSAPFLFIEQLRLAFQVIAVPFERLDELEPDAPATQPVFVFSPGRTGSTLLARVLGAAGLACASEPDMLTQVAWMGRPNRLRLPGAEALLAGACVSALGRALGPGAFIKLRSQCNERPLAMIEATPGCRVIFMLRGMTGWALSRHRVFQEPPQSVAAVLRQAMDSLDKLAGAGVTFDVLWFETLAADPEAALRICAPGRKVSRRRLARVMAADSQEGTVLARSLVHGLPVQDGFMAAFAEAWDEARAGAVWSDQTESLLAEMWAG